jgi:hypothetical protein
MQTYNIQISLNDADDQDAPPDVDTFMVCIYADDGDGSPLYEYHEELEELGSSMGDAELIRDY